MKKVALVFVLAVFVPSLVLAWLAMRSLRDQRFLLERQQSLLYQGVADSLTKEIQNLLADRVNFVCRDFVEHSGIGKLCAHTGCSVRVKISCAGIVDTCTSGVRIGRVWQVRRALRKVARSLQVGGNNAFQIDGVVLASLFQIEEEESLVFYQRTAH